MTKRLIRFLFCAGLLLGLLTVTALAAAPEGTGTAEDPYQISSAEELYWFAGLVNGKLGDGTPQNTAAHAVLTADITINENVLTTDGKLNGSPAHAWTPIGKDGSVAYTGTFDGQNHTISGLYVNINDASSTTYVGLFGRINGSGTVENVKVADSYLSASTTDGDDPDSCAYAGGICGYSYYGTIEACHFDGTVRVDSSNAYVGGVCGYNLCNNEGFAAIANCSSTGTVRATGDTVSVGGMCGVNEGTCNIEGCWFEGTVTGSGNVGGVCGWNYGSDIAGDTTRITNCSSAGTVSGSGNVGGVCGLNDGDTIINCYNTGAVSGNGNDNVGGVCGESNGAIVNCYNIGTVSGNGNGKVGGVCGQDNSDYGDGSLITNCYWLQDTASSGIGNGNGEATAKKPPTNSPPARWRGC